MHSGGPGPCLPAPGRRTRATSMRAPAVHRQTRPGLHRVMHRIYERNHSAIPEDDASAVEVIGGDLDPDLVAGQDADAEPAHLAGEMGEQLVVVLELHAEQQV